LKSRIHWTYADDLSQGDGCCALFSPSSFIVFLAEYDAFDVLDDAHSADVVDQGLAASSCHLHHGHRKQSRMPWLAVRATGFACIPSG
jgi:hypothetical protein